MLRIAFATCVELGLSCIKEIYRINGKIDLLITLKDKKARKKSGRIYLDDIAKNCNVPLLKIDNINDDEVITALVEYNIDWLFIIGWSQIARKKLLNTPHMGCIGMHPTLLPVGRGRAAIPWAILKQVPETGVTLFKLDEGVDTGNIIGQEKIKLDPSITATELYEKINLLHICLINKFWDDIVNNKVVLFIQDESKATEWTERKPEDGEILSKMTVEEAERLVRAVTKPYPGAFYIEGKKKTIIWSAKIDKFKGQIRFKDGYLNPVDYDVEYLS